MKDLEQEIRAQQRLLRERMMDEHRLAQLDTSRIPGLRLVNGENGTVITLNEDEQGRVLAVLRDILEARMEA